MKLLMWNLTDTVVGGVEKYLHDLTKELVRRGHRVVSIFTNSHEQREDPGKYYLPGLGPTRLKEVLYNFTKGMLKREVKQLDKILAKEKPDLIHVHNYFTPFLLRLAKIKIPIVHSVHDYYYVCPILFKILRKSQKVCPFPLGPACLKECYPPDQYFDYVMRYVSRESVMDADRIQVFSTYMKKVLIRNGFQEKKIDVIPYITDTPLEGGVSSDEPMIVFVGRLSFEKGAKQFIEALNNISDRFSAVLIGDGPEKNFLQEMVERQNLKHKVRFTGWLNTIGIRRYYRRARVIVVPSIWPEPFGIVGIEAMAMAKPVVAFNVGGIPEWLEDKVTGYLVPAGDTDRLAEKIVRLLQNPEKAYEFGRSGQMRLIEKFSTETHLHRLIHLYDTALRG